jgi:UDP-glucuronate decarboxylase
VYGTGNQTRSFCYVDDMTEALVALSQADTSGPVNLGNPAEFTILTLARLVCDLLGIPESRIVFRPLPADDPTQRRPDITLASSLLDWTPTVALRQGIMDTIAHYRTVLTPTGGIHA